jgi:coenzyme F420-reducing hydrogenase delta subunit
MASLDGEFIVKFIAEASRKGMSAVEAAQQEIDNIDEHLQEAERLKLRRMKLITVLEHLGDESHRRRRTTNVPVSGDIDDNSFEEFKDKIKTAIEERGPLTVNELILEVGSYDQDTLIMRAVKWMGDEEIVSRDKEGRVQPGKNWNQ